MKQSFGHSVSQLSIVKNFKCSDDSEIFFEVVTISPVSRIPAIQRLKKIFRKTFDFDNPLFLEPPYGFHRDE